MKKGDIAVINHDSHISVVNAELRTVTISIQLKLRDDTATATHNVLFPIEFGIFSSLIERFINPGPFLDEGEEHYYESIGHEETNDGFSLIVLYNGVSHKLTKDKSFSSTGKYYLIPFTQDTLIVKYSREKYSWELQSGITNIINKPLKKGTIKGICVCFIDPKTNTVFENINDSSFAKNCLTLLHDRETKLEVLVPFELLKKM